MAAKSAPTEPSDVERDAERYRAKRAIDLRKFLSQHPDDRYHDILSIGFIVSYDASMDAAIASTPAPQASEGDAHDR